MCFYCRSVFTQYALQRIQHLLQFVFIVFVLHIAALRYDEYDGAYAQGKDDDKVYAALAALGQLAHDACVQLLPQCFSTAVANEKGEELGIKSRAVSYHLRTLCAKGYIERVRQGVYRKVAKRVSRKNRPAA